MYGGRAIDSFDRRILTIYMDEYLGDFLFDTFQPFHFFRNKEVDYKIPVGDVKDKFVGEARHRRTLKHSQAWGSSLEYIWMCVYVNEYLLHCFCACSHVCTVHVCLCAHTHGDPWLSGCLQCFLSSYLVWSFCGLWCFDGYLIGWSL